MAAGSVEGGVPGISPARSGCALLPLPVTGAITVLPPRHQSALTGRGAPVPTSRRAVEAHSGSSVAWCTGHWARLGGELAPHGGDSSSLENNGAMSKMKHMTCPPRHLVLCPSEMPIAGGHPGPLQGCRGVLRGQGRVENRIAPCGNSCPRGGKGCRPGASPGPRRAPGPAAPTTPRGSAGSFWL